jgi:hypothetical protein
MDRLIDQERVGTRSDPEREAAAWAEKVTECDRLRGAYQDQQAAGLMTLAELGSKMEELEGTRRMAEAELAALAAREERAEELERDRDALLEIYAGAIPEALDRLDGEERNTVYRMLRLEITPQEDRTLDVRGILSDSLQICDENGGVEGGPDFVPTERHLPPRHNCESYSPLTERKLRGPFLGTDRNGPHAPGGVGWQPPILVSRYRDRGIARNHEVHDHVGEFIRGAVLSAEYIEAGSDQDLALGTGRGYLLGGAVVRRALHLDSLQAVDADLGDVLAINPIGVQPIHPGARVDTHGSLPA